jgi:hypothetical protein
MTGRRGWPPYLGCLIPLGTALLLLVVLPYSFIAFLFWAADGSWDFEGRGGVRYWVFVKGSRLDRLGLVSPETSPPPRYSVSLQEGNFPGWRVLSYQSAETPETIVAIYAKRCTKMGLKITRGPEPQTYDGEETGATLVCEIEPYLDAEFHAGRKAGAVTTEVGLRIWGSD